MGYSPKEIINILEENGFKLIRIKGSHHIFQNNNTGKMAVVPVNKKDLPKGTYYGILRQAGIDKE